MLLIPEQLIITLTFWFFKPDQYWILSNNWCAGCCRVGLRVYNSDCKAIFPERLTIQIPPPFCTVIENAIPDFLSALVRVYERGLKH